MASPESPGPSASPDQPIHHDAVAGRFTTRVDGVEAVLDYRLAGDLMMIEHTGVPPEIGGRGIAGRLVRAAFDHARGQGWQVRPACSYAEVWAQRHPEYHSLLA